MNEESTQPSEAPKQEAPSNASQTTQDVKGAVNQLEGLLDEYLVKKAPFTLPGDVQEFIVKVMPYVVIIFALTQIPAFLVLFGISTIFLPFMFMTAGGGFIGAIVSLIAVVVELMAVKGLFGMTRRGWQLAFYASIIGLIGSILSFNIFNGLLGAIIGWYFLFQVKSLYKN